MDRPRVDDAYRAYAYFRWLDDLLDAETAPESAAGDTARLERERLLARQQSLLDRCLRGEAPREVNQYEAMLVELVDHADRSGGGLDAYLRQMMRVMEFDVRRRGRLISQAELDDYTRSLAIAVTEAMHHFIGHGAAAPRDETRYLAASGAHILHMLRDTDADLRAGYVNIPREVLETGGIGPADVHSEPYRAWVRDRVQLARADLEAGRAYFARVASRRYRLAGLAYICRFRWLIETIERDDFRLRPEYAERRSRSTWLRMGRLAIAWMTGVGARGKPSLTIASPGRGRS